MDMYSMRQKADAWMKVVSALDEQMPQWRELSHGGLEAAVAAINEMGACEDQGSYAWINWRGAGSSPVIDESKIEIKMRDGNTRTNITGSPLRWEHIGSHCDIVAYRPIKKDKNIFSEVSAMKDKREHTGGSVTYYGIELANGTKVQCNDVIKALNMTYAEGNVFKAVWRIAAARQGKSKRGYDDSLYDADKVVFFGNDMIEAAKAAK